MINTICFDLDSTLVDSELVILKTFKHVFNKYRPSLHLSLEDCKFFIGPTLKETFTKYSSDEEEVKAMTNCYLDYYKAVELSIIKLFPTVKETLKYLHDNDFNICLITNKFLTSAVPSLVYLSIMEYFNNFVCLERQELPKPSAFPILLAIKDYGVKKENVLMVGDNFVDIMSAKNAQVKFVGMKNVSWVDDVIKLNPDYMIDEMKELIDIINDLNKGV